MDDPARQYECAPITEAIIDLRVSPCEGLRLDALRELPVSHADVFPTREPTIEAVGTFQVEPGVAASASAQQTQTGYKFASADGRRIVQQRFHGFTYSRLAPYESWRPFRDQAKSLWQQYRERVAPAAVTRLAVRYINRIDLPGPCELKDYFRTVPEVSPALPQNLSGFFMQLRLCLEEQVELVINQAPAKSDREGVASVILDLDLFLRVSVMQSEEEIWQFFETLHAQKNFAFEACLTDRSRELFQPCQP